MLCMTCPKLDASAMPPGWQPQAICCGDKEALRLAKLKEPPQTKGSLDDLEPMEAKHRAAYPDNRAGRRAYERAAKKRR